MQEVAAFFETGSRIGAQKVLTRIEAGFHRPKAGRIVDNGAGIVACAVDSVRPCGEQREPGVALHRDCRGQREVLVTPAASRTRGQRDRRLAAPDPDGAGRGHGDAPRETRPETRPRRRGIRCDLPARRDHRHAPAHAPRPGRGRSTRRSGGARGWARLRRRERDSAREPPRLRGERRAAGNPACRERMQQP